MAKIQIYFEFLHKDLQNTHFSQKIRTIPNKKRNFANKLRPKE